MISENITPGETSFCYLFITKQSLSPNERCWVSEFMKLKFLILAFLEYFQYFPYSACFVSSLEEVIAYKFPLHRWTFFPSAGHFCSCPLHATYPSLLAMILGPVWSWLPVSLLFWQCIDHFGFLFCSFFLHFSNASPFVTISLSYP